MRSAALSLHPIAAFIREISSFSGLAPRRSTIRVSAWPMAGAMSSRASRGPHPVGERCAAGRWASRAQAPPSQSRGPAQGLAVGVEARRPGSSRATAGDLEVAPHVLQGGRASPALPCSSAYAGSALWSSVTMGAGGAASAPWCRAGHERGKSAATRSAPAATRIHRTLGGGRDDDNCDLVKTCARKPGAKLAEGRSGSSSLGEECAQPAACTPGEKPCGM